MPSTTGVVALAFGKGDSLPANEEIAKVADTEARQRGRLFTQMNVPLFPCCTGGRYTLDYATEKFDSPPSTWRIARGAVVWAHQRGLTEIVVVAAPPHLWRCLRDLRQAAKNANLDIKFKVSDMARLKRWYCPDSGQWRTRQAVNWWLREIPLRLLPFWLYARITDR